MSYFQSDSFYSSSEFQLFFKSSPRSLILKADAPRFTILAVSDTYLDLVHKECWEILGKGLFEAFPGSEGDPSEKSSVLHALIEVIETKVAVFQPIFKYEIFVAETGKYETYYWHNQHEAVLDDSGNVAYIINTTTNITERIQLEQAFKESRAREQELNAELTISNEKLTLINGELSSSIQEMRSSNEDIGRLNNELNDSSRQLKQMNDILSESEHRFRNMAEGSGVLIGMGNAAGDVIYFNKAWSKLTGKSVEELLAFGWSELIHPDDKQDYLKLYMTAVKEQVPYTAEYKIMSATGEYRWLLAFASPRFDAHGRFAGFIGSFIDITERKADEQRKNDFIGMVSHELKTPLTSLNGYLQILHFKVKKGEGASVIGMFDKANQTIRKMTAMINGFLNVSRLESGKIHIELKHFDLAGLVREAQEETLSMVTSHHVIFAPVVETFVIADYDKIGHVISNLISNAVKYAPAGTTIHVACVTINDRVQFSVQDQGVGIAPENLDKLFDRYYRTDNAAASSVSGFGIGLYLSAEIIRRHEGRIWVESVPDKGSTFYFSLPVAV